MNMTEEIASYLPMRIIMISSLPRYWYISDWNWLDTMMKEEKYREAIDCDGNFTAEDIWDHWEAAMIIANNGDVFNGFDKEWANWRELSKHEKEDGLAA